MPNDHFPKLISVVKKFLARPQHEGVGAIVRRSIGKYGYDDAYE
jgi:hypothetical protein